MNYDEFAFFNQQLAGMLRDGIPIEGALQKLCAEMRRSPLKSELEILGADLAKGVPLRDAVRARDLPDLYRQMLEVGVQSNDLPAVLTLLADHYQRRHTIWTRLKGLMVYPAMVLCGAFLLSCFLAVMLHSFLAPNMEVIAQTFEGRAWQPLLIGIWMPPVLLGLLVAVFFIGVTLRPARRALCWRFAAFRESSLAHFASAMALMLKSGVPLDNALALMERVEQGTRAGEELTLWRQRLASGRAKFDEVASGGKIFPPLFVWMIASAREDLAGGFQRASEIYQARASYRAELLLYSALPCSVLALGVVIVSQLQPVVSSFAQMIRMLSDF